MTHSNLDCRRWSRHLCCFYEIKTFRFPCYLSNLISSGIHSCNTQNSEDIGTYHCQTDTFKYSFFPSTTLEWNKLDSTLCKSSCKIFRNYLLIMICSSPNLVYDVHNPLGFCLLTRLRLGLSHLNEHKFSHSFENCVNPLCTCSLGIESTLHFFLYCIHYNNIHTTLLNKLRSLDENILKLSDTTLTNLMLYGGSQVNIKQNTFILNAVESNQCNDSLF